MENLIRFGGCEALLNEADGFEVGVLSRVRTQPRTTA
jgi:hypothetical protein